MKPSSSTFLVGAGALGFLALMLSLVMCGASIQVSDEIKNAAKSYRDSWERTADPFVGKVRDVADAAASAAGGLFDRINRRNGS